MTKTINLTGMIVFVVSVIVLTLCYFIIATGVINPGEWVFGLLLGSFVTTIIGAANVIEVDY